MTAQIENLANLMRARLAEGSKFVLMLGAGASMSSGAKSTPKIMEELLQQFGQGLEGATLEDRFDQLWRASSDADRRRMLHPYLNLTPSRGYATLARLIEAGYFDLIVTFNFDTLVEKSLAGLGSDFKLVIRGETRDDEMGKLLESREPRVKIAKLHGSFRATDYFLFSADEMLRYPEPIANVLGSVTAKDIIVCGYGFNDPCVLRAFSEQGGLVVCVAPNGVPRNLKVFQRNRRSETWAIPVDFDTFFTELQGALLEPAGPVTPPLNPFKFLESYEQDDAGFLMGREEETTTFLDAMQRKRTPQVIILAGPRRVGKTSLVKAALLPALKPEKYLRTYLRCHPDLETTLPRDLCRLGLCTEGSSLEESLQQLEATAAGRHVVLFLDHFDRLASRFPSPTRSGQKDLINFLAAKVFPLCREGVTMVLVVHDEGPLVPLLCEQCSIRDIPVAPMVCPAFDGPAVVGIIQTLAAKEGIEFDPRIVEDLAQRYEQSRDAPAVEKRFSLAHVQAVCHILAGARRVDYGSYELAFKSSQEALNQAINVCEIISFVEDFSWSDASWLRNMIKVPLKESRERIAEFIKSHYEELVPRQARRAPPPPPPPPPPPQPQQPALDHAGAL